MVPAIVSDIIALPGWNAPMLLLLAKATLILVAALGITVAMQRGSAGARHLVWLATLAIVLLVPAVTAWVPPLRLRILPPVTQSAPVERAAPATLPATTTERTIEPANTAPVTAPSSIVTEESGFFSRLSGISLALALWAGIALALTGWLAYGALMVRRIVRNSHSLDTSDWRTPLYEVADRLELDEPPRAPCRLRNMERRPPARRSSSRARTREASRPRRPYARSSRLRALLVPPPGMDGGEAAAE